jgi:hypothetical protein
MAMSGSGSNNLQFSGVKVFSATMAQERDQLGEKITQWLKANPGVEIIDKIVTQSSDEAFHCLAITLFYNASAK